MRNFFIFISLALILLISISLAEARSGCCSWHDGVCGCRCCDGTPLSDKCAPYYPSCNSTPVYVPPPKPTCPANSYYSTTGGCICNSGYAVYFPNNSCVKIPNNAHALESSTEAWECDYGYEEIDNSCIKKVEPVIEI